LFDCRRIRTLIRLAKAVPETRPSRSPRLGTGSFDRTIRKIDPSRTTDATTTTRPISSQSRFPVASSFESCLRIA